MKQFKICIVCFFGILLSLGGCETPTEDKLFYFMLPGSGEEPKIVTTYPTEGMKGIDGEEPLWILFDRPMDTEQVESLVKVIGDSGEVPGDYKWENTKLFFSPRENMGGRDIKQLLIPGSAESDSGVDLGEDYIVHFYANADLDRPSFVSSDPASGDTTMESPFLMTLTFDEPILFSTLESGITITPDFFHQYRQSGDGSEIIIEALADLDIGSTYKVSLSEELTDLEGNKLQEAVDIIFVHGDDTDLPEILSIAAGSVSLTEGVLSTGVDKNDAIQIQFSEPMDVVSFESSFSISPAVSVEYTWNSDNSGVIISFPDGLTPEELYEATISSGVVDVSGQSLGDEKVYRFTVTSSLSIRPEVVQIRQFMNVPSGDDIRISPPYTYFPPMSDLSVVDIDHYDDVDGDTLSIQEVMWFQVEFTNDMVLGSFIGNVAVDQIIDPTFSEFDVYDLDLSGNLLILKIEFEASSPSGADDIPIYKITISGGDDGVVDVNGNHMAEDYELLFTFN